MMAPEHRRLPRPECQAAIEQWCQPARLAVPQSSGVSPQGVQSAADTECQLINSLVTPWYSMSVDTARTVLHCTTLAACQVAWIKHLGARPSTTAQTASWPHYSSNHQQSIRRTACMYPKAREQCAVQATATEPPGYTYPCCS
jgi:hypothetical protein